MPAALPIPYTPIGAPVVEKVPFDNIQFHTVTWKPPTSTEYKGKIIFVHGFAESSEVYTEFFDKLSQDGYEIFFFDQRGAGQTSPGKQVGKTNEYHVFRDLDYMIELQSKKSPNEKFHLMGHSMGGGIVLNYGIIGTHRNLIKSISCSGPLILLHPKTQPNIILRSIMPIASKLLPNVKIDSKINYDFITSDEKWKKYIESGDKLLGTIIQFSDMFARGVKLTNPEYTKNWDTGIPLLVFHGTTDYINDVKGSEIFIKSLPETVNKKFIAVKNGRHSLFLENPTILASVLSELQSFLQ